jgi:hypothetical protein
MTVEDHLHPHVRQPAPIYNLRSAEIFLHRYEIASPKSSES